jgi:hypothetical protein
MFARMLLPKLGGAPAVWNTCVAFYQLVLLAGYAYAHAVVTLLRTRAQIVLHVMLLLAAALTLPVGVARSWSPSPSANPALAALGLLAGSLGLPFFVLAGSGPLLQYWFVSRHGARGTTSNPYRLYAASNVGSLLALLAYPLAIEPALRLREQSLLWTAGYAALVLIAVSCGVVTWRSVRNSSQSTRKPGAHDQPRQADPPDPGVGPGSDPVTPARRLQWLALAFAPSSLMLSVTTFISTDIAAIPLLWVVPLALYLVTLVMAFADRQFVPQALIDFLFPAAVVATVTLILAETAIPVRYEIWGHMIAFVVVALRCHMTMAALRPSPTRLTEFYLWIAAGGALGGLFNTFAAPVLFNTPIEYPLVVIAVCLLFPDVPLPGRGVQRRPVPDTLLGIMTLWPVLLLIVFSQLIYRVDWGLPEATRLRSAFAVIPAVAVAFILGRSPWRLGVALALVLIAEPWVRVDDRVTLHIERSFFGVHRVNDTGFEHVLQSGTTNHGSQAVDPALNCEPLSYYTRVGPIGQLFASFATGPGRTRFGVIGLGTASMAAYAKPGDSWTFFEINPAVERLARNPDYFTFLRDCAPGARVVLGDARQSLERVPDGAFDVLVVDAFSSDAIPVHLMTAEAVALYFRKLTPDGLLVLHVSNRYLDLAPVVAAIVNHLGLTAMIQHYQPNAGDERELRLIPSTWIVAGRRRIDLQPLLGTPRWQEPVAPPGPLWTDDYSNVLRIVRR